MFPAIKRELIKFFLLRNNDCGRFCWIVCKVLLFQCISLRFCWSLGIEIYLCLTASSQQIDPFFRSRISHFSLYIFLWCADPVQAYFSPWETFSALHETCCRIARAFYHLGRVEDIKYWVFSILVVHRGGNTNTPTIIVGECTENSSCCIQLLTVNWG